MKKIFNVSGKIIIPILIWYLVTRYFNIPRYLIPSPQSVGLFFILSYDVLLLDTIVTGFEAFLGFIIAIICSILLSLWLVNSKSRLSFVMPYLIALKAIPIIAIAPLLVIWFGNGYLSKALMSAIISFFPIVVSLIRGLKFIPEEEEELFNSYSASAKEKLIYLQIPNSLPFFMSGVKIASTLSVVGAIVGETVGSNIGLGHLIIVSALRIDTPALFNGIILSSLLGVSFYYSLELIEKRYIFWKKIDD